jgi:hypothetical protein
MQDQTALDIQYANASNRAALEITMDPHAPIPMEIRPRPR